MPDIISIGECMIELFSEKPIESADSFTRSFAGESVNILVAASRLGNTTGYITRLGSDPFTTYLLDSWRSEGIDTSQSKQVSGFNAVHFVATLPNGERDFVYYRKGSAPTTINPADIDPNYISQAKIMHISGVAQGISPTAGDAVLHAAQIARENSITVSYDPNYRHQLWSHSDARAGMKRVIPYVDYFLPSLPADTEVLFGTQDPNKIIDQSLELGAIIVAIKMGAYGAIIGTKHETFSIPPYNSGPVVDTTAAGDAFNAGFLHGMLNNMSPKDAGTFAAITAGIKIRGRGAISTMPTGREVYKIFDLIR